MTVRCEKSTRDRAHAPAGKPGRSPRSPSPPSNAGQGSGSTRTQGVVTRSVSLGGGTIRPCHARRLNAGSFAPPKGGAGVGFSAAGGPRRGSSTQIARSGKGRARLDVNDLSPKCKEKPRRTARWRRDSDPAIPGNPLEIDTSARLPPGRTLTGTASFEGTGVIRRLLMEETSILPAPHLSGTKASPSTGRAALRQRGAALRGAARVPE